MKNSKYLTILILSIAFLKGNAQEISIHPTPKIDTVWYSDVTEDSEPKPMSCEENSIGYFRLKFNAEIVIDDFKKDTIKTKKEDWEKEDEEAFDEEYNKEKKKELEELENEFIEEDEDIASLTREEIDRYIDVNWNGYGYNICKPDCESSVQQCYIYHEITQLKDYKKRYSYRTSYSWLEFKDEGDNEVEVDLDLVITYETLIYFFVTCSCDDIPDLISVPSRQLNESNPWAHIDITGEIMKPGHPFASGSKFPTLPVVGTVLGGGALIYLLTRDEEDDLCSFTSTVQVTNSKCGDSSGNAEVILTPSGDYTYEWSSGQKTPTINNVEAGNYTVTVTPTGQECPKTINVIIGDDVETISNTITTTNSDCGQNNGTASIDNPAIDQDYNWSDGSTGTMASGLSQGTHTLTISKGTCSSTIEFTIEENLPNFEITGDISNPACGKADGSISTSVNPQGNYQYQWSNGESESSQSQLMQGSYTVTIIDSASGCSKSQTFTLEDLPADFNLTFTTTEATCGVSDGGISVSVDATGTYQYLWSNGETTASLSNQAAGNYSVTVTLIDTECAVEGSAAIEEKPFPVDIEFINTNPNCGLADGEILLQLTPDGSYTFEWSNGAQEQSISKLSKGTYSVTITDQNGCTASGSTNLEDQPIDYIDQIESSPGNCITSGEITITLSTPGDGPIVTIINGPDGQETISLNTGTHDLSTMTDIPPGSYTIEVYDQNAGVNCNQTANIEVVDNTPNLLARDDDYETEGGESISGNVLNNDEGLDIMVNSFFDVNGGTTNVNSNGEFQFSPADDFVGEASFNYIIEDACGSLDTAKVIINVKMIGCTFITEFETVPANCGLEDGHAFALVEPPGNYSYLWSNGNTSSELSYVASGTYGLSITDTDLGCTLEYIVVVPEKEINYVSNIITLEPSCSTSGEIHFVLGNTEGPFLVTVTHPNGIDAFLIPSGTVLLSDYIFIVSGEYEINVYDSNAGPECSETFSVIVEEYEGFVITVTEIISPTTSTANDGSVVIEVTIPSTPPYTIWVNDEQWDITTDNEFIITGLGAGEYEIYITDVFGCISNVVSVFVPPPTLSTFTIGVGLLSLSESSKEKIPNKTYSHSLPYLEVAGNFKYLGLKTSNSFKLISSNDRVRYSLASTVEVYKINFGKNTFSINSGGIIYNDHESGYELDWVFELTGQIVLRDNLNFKIFASKSQQVFIPFGLGLNLVY